MKIGNRVWLRYISGPISRILGYLIDDSGNNLVDDSGNRLKGDL